jgi:BCD family chlorophyll transporter-like MFS transporter
VKAPNLSWFGIVRLGLVQASLGAVVVLVISTLNRVMVVEYALPAFVPGVFVAYHYLVQMARPRVGYGSDRGGRQTPWIFGGIAVLGLGGILCAIATVLLPSHRILALALGLIAYTLVGLGVAAAGTTLLVLLAKRVEDARRAAAATVVWCCMILGFALASGTAGFYLKVFSPRRLIEVFIAAALVAMAITLTALHGIETRAPSEPGPSTATPTDRSGFRHSLAGVWNDPQARQFTFFVFLSMLAYSAEELLLEPFAGLVYGYSVGQSAQLSGLMHGGVLLGMILVGVLCSGARRMSWLQGWTAGGCLGSALALLALATSSATAPRFSIGAITFTLGCANGVFAVAAIASMMQLSRQGKAGSEGVRMGVWGAAQAVAFACGGLLATSLVEGGRRVLGSAEWAYCAVFVFEGSLFLLAALLPMRMRTVVLRLRAAQSA